MKPEIIQAFKCPETGDVFTSEKEWNKHVSKLLKAKEREELKKTRRADAVEALAGAVSLQDAFDRMNAVIRKHHNIKGYNGKRLKVEIQIADPSVSISSSRSNKQAIEIRRYRLCMTADCQGFGSSELEHLFWGLIESGSGGYAGSEWTSSDGTHHKNGNVCEYNLRIFTDAIPEIMKKVKRFSKLQEYKAKWYDRIDRSAQIARDKAEKKDPTLKDRIIDLEKQEEDYRNVIKEFQNLLDGVSDQKRKAIQAREDQLSRLKEQFMKQIPFKHSTEME